jgi:hypothetical protein
MIFSPKGSFEIGRSPSIVEETVRAFGYSKVRKHIHATVDPELWFDDVILGFSVKPAQRLVSETIRVEGAIQDACISPLSSVARLSKSAGGGIPVSSPSLRDLSDSARPERINAVAAFGFTERQARFLVRGWCTPGCSSNGRTEPLPVSSTARSPKTFSRGWSAADTPPSSRRAPSSGPSVSRPVQASL